MAQCILKDWLSLTVNFNNNVSLSEGFSVNIGLSTGVFVKDEVQCTYIKPKLNTCCIFHCKQMNTSALPVNSDKVSLFAEHLSGHDTTVFGQH